MEPVGAIAIACGIYWGLSNIASAIRTRRVDVNLPPIEVRHRQVEED